ncbi:MAG: ABC transporter ATP-binding protein [Deltaproteobacteria bacterium]|nr:ABC transporter ATP-binding protein [Deltaproteobacteria bacterium]MBW2353769.1 ABC transporter ATP-binding protein [Deltaproteobacteria bacterium]
MNPRSASERFSPFPLKKALNDFRPLAVYFAENRLGLALGLLSLLIVDFLLLLIPLLIRRAVDLLVIQPPGTGALLLGQGALIALMALVIALFRYLWRRLILGHARRVEQGLRNRLYAHLQTLSMGFFQRVSTGDLMARAINDINAVRMATGMGLVALLDGTILGIAGIGFMVSIDLNLTLISLIPAPVIIVLTRILTRRMATGFEAVQRGFAELTERIREAFAGIRVIKAHNRETWTYDRVREQGEIYVAQNVNLARALALFFPLMSIFTNAGLAMAILLGGRYAILGNITPGDFVAFMSYLNLLTWPMIAMGWVANLIQRSAASMRRINQILEEVPDIRDPGPLEQGEGRVPAGDFPRPMRGEVEIRDLDIRYPGQSGYALRGICLKIHASETVALVGRVGSGKTTLLRAIPRILEVREGTVFLDGQDVRGIPLALLRGSIAFVPQEVFLFSDSIRNNVIFGRSRLDDGDLEEALRVAGMLEEIRGFERGVDAVLGERGITLSGGQRQRLTIARAIIRPLPLLILDDALSMVDTRTEQEILNRILRLRRNRTNLIVSHRVSTIKRAHRIVVLDRGEVVEEGTHEALMALGGVYAALYEEQRLAEELDL